MKRQTVIRQENIDRVEAYLRKQDSNHQPKPTIHEIAEALGMSGTTVTDYLREMKRVGILSYRQDGSRIVARTVHLTDWKPQ